VFPARGRFPATPAIGDDTDVARLVIAVLVVVVLIAIIAWALVELRPGAERKAREAEERRERREADAAVRFPIGSVVRCEECGANAAEVREEPFVSERRREVRALVACSSCGAVARRRLARLPSGR
jgi:uncharacterized Zn finger protein